MAAPIARNVVTLGVAQTLAWGSTYYLPAILANAMARDVGTGTPFVFAAFSGGLLASALLAPLAGRLIDRVGGKWVLAASNLVFALGLVQLGHAGDSISLLAGWLLLGIGMSGGLYEAAFSTLAGIYGSAARRPVTGITLIAGFASTVCWPLSAWMEARYGWRDTCLVWAAVHVLVALPLNLSLPGAAHRREPGKEAEKPADVPHKAALMAGLSFVFAATWFCSTAMAAHLPRLLQEAGATLPAAVAAASLVGPAQVAARVLEFWLMRQAHPVVSARAAALAHPIGAAGLLALGAPFAPFFTFAHGAGNGVMTIASGTLPLQYFGPGGYGLRQGLLMIPARLVQAGAPFAFDLVLSRYGPTALVLTACVSVLSFCVLMLLPRSRAG